MVYFVKSLVLSKKYSPSLTFISTKVIKYIKELSYFMNNYIPRHFITLKSMKNYVWREKTVGYSFKIQK